MTKEYDRLKTAIEPMEVYLDQFLKGVEPNMGNFLQSLKGYFESDGEIISKFSSATEIGEAKEYLESILRMQGMITFINKLVGENK